jgi:hypothetical protein
MEFFSLKKAFVAAIFVFFNKNININQTTHSYKICISLKSINAMWSGTTVQVFFCF